MTRGELGVAVVVGGTGPIGRAVVDALAARGHTVRFAYARDRNRAESVVAAGRERGFDIDAMAADATDERAVAQLIEAARGAGRVVVWVNAVGPFSGGRTVDEVTAATWRHVVEQNLTSAFVCSRAILPTMRIAGGAIVNLGVSGAERARGAPRATAYVASKAALAVLTRSMAHSEGRHGIRVNQVNPGYIDGGRHTPESVPATVLLKRLGTAEEVASAVCFLASAEASYVTGAVLNVDGGAFL